MSIQPKGLGHSILDQFLLDKNWRNLNHGAYGTFPAEVRDEHRKFQDMIEARPDEFIRYLYPKFLDTSRNALASYLNVAVSEVVFVKSATTAVNTVLRNLSFGPRDMIIYFSTIFSACETTIQSVMETTPLKARKIDVLLPTRHEDILASFLQTVHQAKQEGFNVRIALFETISSLPGARFPFERITEACREHGILSFIDGAHGVGHIPLDLGKLGPDFFVSMTQKWLYNPRGCSVFHVPLRNQHLIGTTIPTSHGFIPKQKLNDLSKMTESPHPASKSPFELLFQNVAITDDTPYLTIPAALQYRSRIPGGEHGISNYIREIAFHGGNLVAQILETEVLGEPNHEQTGPCRIRDCAFANVRLPFMISDCSSKTMAEERPNELSNWRVLSTLQAMKVAKWLQDELVAHHSTSVPAFIHNSALWVRVSGQIYLELEDFEWLGHVLKGVCAEAWTMLKEWSATSGAEQGH